MNVVKDISASFSLIDYLAYFFPGLFVMSFFSLLHQNIIIDNLKTKPFIAGALFLVISYLLGVICLQVSWIIFVNIIYSIFGDPRKCFFSNSWFWNNHDSSFIRLIRYPILVSATFKDQLRQTMENRWGTDLTNSLTEYENEFQLFDLCLQDIRKHSTAALGIINRLNSLANMAESFVGAAAINIFLLIAFMYNCKIKTHFIYKHSSEIFALLICIFFISLISMVDWRKVTTKLVYFTFYSIYTDCAVCSTTPSATSPANPITNEITLSDGKIQIDIKQTDPDIDQT